MEKQNSYPDAARSCACLALPSTLLVRSIDLGMDSHFAEVSVHLCPTCGRHWLRYFFEIESFTGSGRWFLGAITPEQMATLGTENAKGMIEALDWHYYGGSYFDGESGRRSGELLLNP